MVIEVSYGFYQESYGGNLVPEKSWERVLRKAEGYLNRVMHQPSRQSQLDLVKLALCEAAELIYQDEKQRAEHGGRQVKSENTDGYSVTYAAEGESTGGTRDPLAGRIYSCIRRYLGHTGLLYAGVNTCADKCRDYYF